MATSSSSGTGARTETLKGKKLLDRVSKSLMFLNLLRIRIAENM